MTMKTAKGWIRHPVHALLAAFMIVSLAIWPLLTFAPNRLITGQAISWMTLHEALPWVAQLAWLGLLAVILSAAWWPSQRVAGLLLGAAISAFSALSVLAAGRLAQHQLSDPESIARISLGGAWWIIWGCAWLMWSQTLSWLRLSLPWQAAITALLLFPTGWILSHGGADSLSIMKEYLNHTEAFQAAWVRHLQLVFFALVPAIVLGAALGWMAFRWQRFRAVLFPILNMVQTMPSIALFGLLIGPLAWIGQRWPSSGIAGVGMPPALLALTIYSLLPMARSALTGLEHVPDAVRHAARGMGLSRWQLWWKVELPLALPIFLTGMRVTTVQLVGLSEVAALIGAGGFGALMFQGLSSSALDLVLLGVIPVVALAITVDSAFKVLIAVLTPSPSRSAQGQLA